MSSLGPEYVARMRDALTCFRDECCKIINQYQNLPAAGSKAATERAASQSPASVESAWTLGDVLIENGADHLSAFVKLTASPVENLACCTCIRSMLESCAIATWVLDPSIDAVARISRIFAVRYEGLEQQATLMRTTGISANQLANVENRLNDVEQLAVSLGYPRVENTKGKRIGIAERFPSTTDLIDRNLAEGKMYRMLSAVAHGHVWAISQLGFAPTSEVVSFEGTSFAAIQKSVNVQAIALLGLSAMKAFTRPMWNRCHYYGWDALTMEALFEKVADSLLLTNDPRFWRNSL